MKQTAGKGVRRKLSKKVVIVLASIILVLGLLFLLRGWVRMTVLPKSVAVFRKNDIKKIGEEENAKLGDAFKALGYKDYVAKNSCMTDWASGYRTAVICNYFIDAYKILPTSKEDKDALKTSAAKLMAALKVNGWQGQFTYDDNPTSLTKLIDSLIQGIDYSPDATYQKQIDGINCYLMSVTAFSKPSPPAMSTQLNCSKTFNILGDPYK